ncbi:hypothetical protein [Pseudobdellovibrio sp. HCB154]|uniref:hypothetical protein n=1 Tax=Pseudobdellovibrio sp. HCB154 TaxID=3386277 RepID=UPI00391742D4
MKLRLSVIVPLMYFFASPLFAKDSISTESFNTVLEEGLSTEKDIKKNIVRNIGSERVTFAGEVITAGPSRRNPLKFNVFLREDEIKSASDEKKSEN